MFSCFLVRISAGTTTTVAEDFRRFDQSPTNARILPQHPRPLPSKSLPAQSPLTTIWHRKGTVRGADSGAKQTT
jgi:hypothetical protein